MLKQPRSRKNQRQKKWNTIEIPSATLWCNMWNNHILTETSKNHKICWLDLSSYSSLVVQSTINVDEWQRWGGGGEMAATTAQRATTTDDCQPWWKDCSSAAKGCGLWHCYCLIPVDHMIPPTLVPCTCDDMKPHRWKRYFYLLSTY